QEFSGYTFDRRQVSKTNVNAGLQQARQKRDRTCQAIQFGDDQRHLPHPSRSKSLIQFGAIRSAIAFDLNKLADNPPVAAVEVVFDRLPLRLNAEAAFALLAG